MAGPIAVTTFVEIDNLYQSSTFGRILAEQLISELSMKGYNVNEIRLSDAVQIMESEGELGLSREINALRPQQHLSGLVVGTYAVSNRRVYINARLIDPRTSNIISVGSVEMSKSKEISQLLRGNSFPFKPRKNSGTSSELSESSHALLFCRKSVLQQWT
jgi:TolB-like protein